MGYERNSDCWYKEVCQNASCESCTRYLEMQHLMLTSGIPESKQYPTKLVPSDSDYEAFCQLADIKDDIVSFVDRGGNLYICSSNTGNGKTSWSIKLMMRYFDQIWAGNGLRTRGLLVHVPTWLMQLKNFDSPLSQEYKDSIVQADLVIWDDIAHSDISKYDYNNLLMFIDNRIFNGKANIYTSNVRSEKELKECMGSKLASRIWGMSTIIELKGKDRRNG